MTKKILYFGTGLDGSTSLQRFNALLRIYPNSKLLDSRYIFPDRGSGRSKFSSIQVRLGIGPLYEKSREYLVSNVNIFNPDLIWIDAGYLISKNTIALINKINNAFIVHYTPDSLNAPGMNTPTHNKSLSLYDLVVTTKSQDLLRYKDANVKRLLLSWQGYDVNIHSPIDLSCEDIMKYSCDVAFVGNYGRERAKLLSALSHSLDIKIHIYGPRWPEYSSKFSSNTKLFDMIKDRDYAKVVTAAKINLGLLNHSVGDQYTTRSFEIPAIGGFMLADYSEIHKTLFEGGNGACLFTNFDSLCKMITYYLKHESERKKVALNGQKIIESMDVTWDKLMKEICKKIP